MPTAASIMAWLHIMAVVVAVGGSAFALLMLRPTALTLMEPAEAMRLMGAVQARFRWTVWTAIAVFVVTGVYLAWEYRGIDSVDLLFDTTFGRTLFVKSVLAIVLFAGVLSVTLPVSWLAWFRQRQVTILRLNLAVATVIVLFATFMIRRGGLV